MSADTRRSKLPQVNLIPRARRRTMRLPMPRRYVEAALIVVIALIWAIVGLGVVVLLGGHPFGLGL
jgi:hypothetical protein